jgi:hypothetical protein
VSAGDVHAVRDPPHAAGGDEEAVGAAPLDHLGVSRDDLHFRLARGLRHRIRDAFEQFQWQAFLEDERGGEVFGARSWRPAR